MIPRNVQGKSSGMPIVYVCMSLCVDTDHVREGSGPQELQWGLMEEYLVVEVEEEEEEEDHEIFGAVKEGDEGVVTRLLDADPGLLERRNVVSHSLLSVAARCGQSGLVRLLLQRGAPINDDATANWAFTALHGAAWMGHEAIVAFLLSNGADTNIRTEEGETPCMSACYNGHLGVVKMFPQHVEGQGLTDTDDMGLTVLHMAAWYGHVEVVHYLLSKGSQVSVRENRRMTPFMLACEGGHLGVAQMLLQESGGQGLNDADYHGRTALHCAAERGHGEMVRFLHLAGADPTIRNNQGSTPRALAEVEVPADEYMHEKLATGRAACVTVLEWWEGELERRYILSRATSLHKACATHRDMPTSQVPTYLEARVAAGHAVPGVEVVLPESEAEQGQEEGENVEAAGEGGDAQGAEAGEEETRNAVLEYVVGGLNEELLTELLEGFHSTLMPGNEEEVETEEENEENEEL